ncbi:MAG: hypothetical protein QMB25_00465 [Pseudomonadales bacterium]
MNIPSIAHEYSSSWPTADLRLTAKYALSNDLSYDSNPDRVDCPAAYLDTCSPCQRAEDIEAVRNVLRRTPRHEKLIVLGGIVANLLFAQVDSEQLVEKESIDQLAINKHGFSVFS